MDFPKSWRGSGPGKRLSGNQKSSKELAAATYPQQTTPRGPKSAPRGPKTSLRGLKIPQEAPKTLPRGSKSDPRPPETPQSHLRNAPR